MRDINADTIRDSAIDPFWRQEDGRLVTRHRVGREPERRAGAYTKTRTMNKDTIQMLQDASSFNGPERLTRKERRGRYRVENLRK